MVTLNYDLLNHKRKRAISTGVIVEHNAFFINTLTKKPDLYKGYDNYDYYGFTPVDYDIVIEEEKPKDNNIKEETEKKLVKSLKK